MKAYADLGDFPEDDRIRIIGETAASGQRVAFVVEDDEKADRYVQKLRAYKVRVIVRGAGPVTGTIAVQVGPAES